MIDLEKRAKAWDEFSGEAREFTIGDTFNSAYELGVRDGAASVPRWTRVEDGLPESNGPYLFTFAFHVVADDMIGKPKSDNPYYADDKRFGGPRVVEELYYADGKWYLSHDDYHDEPENGMSFDNSQYIAWMPLPQPFTEDTDEQR